MLIDPRAGRLEYRFRSSVDGKRQETEFRPFTVCNAELVKQKIDFIQTPRLDDLGKSYCLPQDAYVEGLMVDDGSTNVMIELNKC